MLSAGRQNTVMLEILMLLIPVQGAIGIMRRSRMIKYIITRTCILILILVE